MDTEKLLTHDACEGQTVECPHDLPTQFKKRNFLFKIFSKLKIIDKTPDFFLKIPPSRKP